MFLAYLHPSLSHAKEVNTAFFSISNQEQTSSIFNQSTNPIELIESDLLELAEDELNHFDKKLVAAIKIACNGDDHALGLSKAIMLPNKRLTYYFINSFSSRQSFLGIYRI